MSITAFKFNFLKYVRVLRNNLYIVLLFFLYGVLCATWRDLWANETANTLTAFSLFISLTALFISNYFIIENARELRSNNKKKLFSDYCARFSSNCNLCKVAEWLLTLAEFDSNGNLIDVYPKRLKDNKGRPISEPSSFEKQIFVDFLVELNIQIKNKQLEKEDIGKYFSPYVLLFKEILQADNNKTYYIRSLDDLSELLS